MGERRGEKIGWIGGWIGSFCWLVILAGVWLIQGKPWAGVIALLFAAMAFLLILRLAPWRFPATRYAWLMAPLCLWLAVAVTFAVMVTGPENLGVSAWSLVWLWPMAIPFFVGGKRRWCEENPNSDPGSRDSF